MNADAQQIFNQFKPEELAAMIQHYAHPQESIGQEAVAPLQKAMEPPVQQKSI